MHIWVQLIMGYNIVSRGDCGYKYTLSMLNVYLLF